MAFSPFRRQKPAMYDYTSSLDQRNEDLLERERRRISYEKYLEFLRLGQSGHDNIQRARQEMESQGLFKSPRESRTVPVQGPPERGHRYTGSLISKVDQPFPIGNVEYVRPAHEDTEEEKQLKSYAAARDVDPEAADAAVRLPKHLTNSSVRSYLNFLDEQRQDALKSGNQERVDQLTKKMVEYNPTEGIDTTLVEGPRLDAIVASRAQRLEHEGRQLRSKAVGRAREAERKDMEVSKARRDIRTDDNLRDLMISMQKHNDEGMAVEIQPVRATLFSQYEGGVDHQKTFDDIKEIYGKHWTPSHTEEWDKWVEETFTAKRAHREVAKHPKASQRAAEEVREKNRRINQERMASGKPQLPEVSLTEMAEKLRTSREGLEIRAEGREQTIAEFNRPYPELGESEVEYTGGGTVHVGSPDTSDRKQWDRERGTNIIPLAIRADGLINKKDILGESVLDRATKHQQDQLFLDVGGSLISDPEKKTWPLPRTPEQRLAAIQHDPNVRESVLVDFLMRSNPSISELDARKYAQIAIKHADEKQAIIEKLGSPNAPDTLLGKLHKAQKEYTRKGDELVQPDIKLVGGMFPSATTRKEATALGRRDKGRDEARESIDRLTELSRKAGDGVGYAAAEKADRDLNATLLYEKLRDDWNLAQQKVYGEGTPIPTTTVDGKTVAVEYSKEQQDGLLKLTGDPATDAPLLQAAIRNIQGAVNTQGLTVEGFGTDYARYVADAPWIPIYHHLMSGGLSAIAYSVLDEKTARTAMNDLLTMPLSAALNVATAGWQAASFVDPSGFSLGVRDKMTRLTNAISEGSQINQQINYPKGVARWATPVWSGGVSAAQMGIYTAAGVPWYGVTSSYFLQSFAQSHLEGLDKGLSDREAVNYGIVMGLGESLPEIAGALMYKKFGFGAGLMKYVMSPKGVLKPAVYQGMAKGFAKGLGWVAKEIGVTMPSEQAQELTTMLIQAWARYQWNIDPNALDSESLARNAIDVVVSTVVATGGTSGTIGSIQYKKAYATQKRNLHEILQHEDFSRISEMTKAQFEEYAKEVFNRRVAENPETKWGELKRFLDRVHQYATQPSLFDGGVGDGFIEAFVEMFPGQTQLIVDGGTSRSDFKKAFMGTLPKGLDTAAAREKFKERAEGELRRREEKITVAQQKGDPGPPKITTWHVPVQMPTSFDEQGEPVYERTFITVKADSMEEASERVANDPRFEGTVVSRQAQEAYTPAEEQQTLFEVEPDYSATEIAEAEEGQPVEPPLPVSIRDDLEEMNPSELDAIAKDLGLKLGGKSSAAKINAILEAQAPTEGARGEVPPVLRESDTVDAAGFKGWFGESEITDDSGSPLEMHHGTSSDFAEFSTEHTGGLINFTPDKNSALEYSQGGGGGRGRGARAAPVVVDEGGNYFFSKDNETWVWDEAASASEAAKQGHGVPKPPAKKSLSLGDVQRGEDKEALSVQSPGDRVVSVYLAVQKPLDTRTVEGQQVIANLDAQGDVNAQRIIEDAQDNVASAQPATLRQDAHVSPLDWGLTKFEFATRAWERVLVPQLKEQGYDGLYVADKKHTTVSVFSPSQVRITGVEAGVRPSAVAKPAPTEAATVPMLGGRNSSEVWASPELAAKAREAGYVENEGRTPQEGDTLEDAVGGLVLNEQQQALWKELLPILQSQEKGVPSFRVRPDMGLAAASYEPIDHVIRLNPSKSKHKVAHSLLHEAMHAATRDLVLASTAHMYHGDRAEGISERSLDAMDRLGAVAYWVRKNRPDYLEGETVSEYRNRTYGTSNTMELVAEAFTNPQFQRWLSTVKVPGSTKYADLRGKTLLQSFIDGVKRLLNIRSKRAVTALEEVLGLSHTVMEEDASRAEQKRKEEESKNQKKCPPRKPKNLCGRYLVACRLQPPLRLPLRHQQRRHSKK